MTDLESEQDLALAARLRLDEHTGPAARISRDRAAAMVEQALSAAAIGAVPARRAPVSFGWIASAAVVLLALAGSAFAAIQYWRAAAAPKAPVAAPSVVSKPVLAPPPKAATADPAVVDFEVQDEPVVAPRQERSVARGDDLPEDLLQAANRLRAQGRFAAAADVYALVYERHAGTTAAYVAQVARASLDLEHLDDPKHARQLFARALRNKPGSALDIEARQGLALASHDLGDRAAEARALRELISAHPQSPAAVRARARLQELSDVTP